MIPLHFRFVRYILKNFDYPLVFVNLVCYFWESKQNKKWKNK